MPCEGPCVMETLLSALVGIWALAHCQFFSPLVFTYESIKVRDSSREIFVNQIVTRIIGLVICIFISDITWVSYILIQRVIGPFLKGGRVVGNVL